MLRDRSYFFLALVPALALLGCGTEKTVDENTSAVQEAIPSGGYHFAGTYTTNAQVVGMFSQLVLKTDGSYRGMRVVACMVYPCPPIEETGSYRLYARETVQYIQFYDAAGSSMGRLQYSLRGDTLSLRQFTASATWLQMPRSQAAWCASTQDCALQDLQIGPCAGQYICTSQSVCNWQCGPAPEIAGNGMKPRSGG